ncbi:MAG: SDR family NAD(P)-dependent oxidoreductase [Bacteroidota bacterium]|nr:SDR family NAD(P)-dependent oxidoreductase [Bacteroidota bacterium]
MNKIVLITGATAGFGEACAYKFAENGYNLILNGRRNDRLELLKEKLQKLFNVNIHLLPFDVRNKEQVFTSLEQIPQEWRSIDVLVNNAGLALGRDLIQEGDIEDWDTMIDTNVKGLLYITRAVVPWMIENKKGHIINLGSIAGKEVYERGNVYCASKFAVDALTKSMRIDLLEHQIKVSSINPGAAETEFSLVRFKGNEEASKKIYEGYTPLTAKDVAEVVYYVTTLPQHVCVNELSITSTQQASAVYFNKKS